MRDCRDVAVGEDRSGPSGGRASRISGASRMRRTFVVLEASCCGCESSWDGYKFEIVGGVSLVREETAFNITSLVWERSVDVSL